MSVSSELISRYVDGRVTDAEAETVRRALEADPVARAEFEEFEGLEDLFGVSDGEPLPEEFLERLCALRPVKPLENFEPVEVADGAGRVVGGGASAWRRWGPRHWGAGHWGARKWGAGSWAAAAAVLFLAVYGALQLAHRPEVTLHGFARYTLAEDGSIADMARADALSVRAGDTLRAAADERLAFALADGSRVALQPGGAIEVGDPRDGELLAVHGGTVLCSVVDAERPRRVRAGDYSIAVANAHFGVRVEGAGVRAAGAAGGEDVRVTITVSRGSLEVARGGEREAVREYERVVLAPGRAPERTHAALDPVFYALMREYRVDATEVVPGYFRGEPRTSVIAGHRWQHDGAARVLAVTGQPYRRFAPRYLVLHVDVDRPTAFEVTRVRPVSGEPGRAEAVTVRTEAVRAGRGVVAVPLAAFSAEDARREVVTLPPSRSRLERIRVRPLDGDARFELKNGLWAGRAPVPGLHAFSKETR